MYLKW